MRTQRKHAENIKRNGDAKTPIKSGKSKKGIGKDKPRKTRKYERISIEELADACKLPEYTVKKWQRDRQDQRKEKILIQGYQEYMYFKHYGRL